MTNQKPPAREVEGKPHILVPTGDWHIGSRSCSRNMIARVLDFCKENDAKILLMGDLIDCGLRSSPGASVYEQTANPHEQMEEVRKLLDPFKENIIGVLTGNHEYRAMKDSGIDLSEILAQALGVKYFGHIAFFTVGGKRFFARHGSGSAIDTEGRLRLVKKYARDNFAECYLMGHTHDLSYSTDYLETEEGTYTRYYVLTGSTLGYGQYAKAAGYPKLPMGSPVIYISENGLDIRINELFEPCR